MPAGITVPAALTTGWYPWPPQPCHGFRNGTVFVVYVETWSKDGQGLGITSHLLPAGTQFTDPLYRCRPQTLLY